MSSRAAPPRAESYAGVSSLSQERCAPCVPAGPDIVQRGDNAALTQATRRCGKLLDLRRWRGQCHSFPRRRAGGESFILFRRWLKGCWQRVPTLSKKKQIPFPPSFQPRGLTVCDALPPHSRPRPILPVAKRVRLGDGRASPRASSQSLQGLREFCKDESERRAFCTIQPYSHSLHHCGYVDCAVGATCTASGGVACAAQPVSLAPGSRRLPFKMLMHRRMIKCIQPWDWIAAIDLKDAYFHVSILLRDRPFLRFASEGRAWQYRVLPFGLSLSPHVFTKIAEGALAPLREVGIRILNCLEHGLRVRTVVRSQGPSASCQLGKEQALPCAENLFSWCGVDSVSMTACLTEERAQSALNCLSSFRGRTVASLKLFQRLLGHMASVAAVTPLGLLHMRPLQHWLHSRVPRWAWRRGALRVNITQECRRSFSPWTDLAFLRAGVHLEQVSRHVVVTTDASSTGWAATCNGQAASGLWTGPRLLWHINCLELLAVHLALRQFRPLRLGKHVLVRTDNTAAVSYINRMGGIRSRCMSQLARHLLLWSHTQLKSLRAVHIPGELNRAADELSRQLTFPGDDPADLESIRGSSGRPVCFPRVLPLPAVFSLTEGTLGMDALAHSWPRALCKYAFPPVSLLTQTLCKVREDEEQVLLVAPFWPTRT